MCTYISHSCKQIEHLNQHSLMHIFKPVSYTHLSHPAVAAQSRNKTAIAGTCTMNTVLAAAYIAEVLKGVRSLPSYLIFLLLCLLPCVTSILAYTKQKLSLIHI